MGDLGHPRRHHGPLERGSDVGGEGVRQDPHGVVVGRPQLSAASVAVQREEDILPERTGDDRERGQPRRLLRPPAINCSDDRARLATARPGHVHGEAVEIFPRGLWDAAMEKGDKDVAPILQ